MHRFVVMLHGMLGAVATRLFTALPYAAIRSEPVASTASYAAIDRYIERQMHRLHIPGVALAIVDGDRVVHLRGFGRSGPQGEVPTPETLFPIASLTKSFTALAIMQLVEAGKLALDAPVQRYLPWFRVADPRASAEMTVYHLLTQTSGLPTLAGELQLVDFDRHPGATARQARELATYSLKYPVGSAWEYSNANYNLLGLIVEAASGEAYADYVHRHIVDPLDMRHTCVSPVEARQRNRAVGHRYWFAVPVAAPNLTLPPGALPGGGLISSAQDLAHWLIAQLNGGWYGDRQILSRAGIAELQRGAVAFHTHGVSMQYGMGWFVTHVGRRRLVWHSGTLPDFGAFMALLPERNTGVVLLFNACHHWYNPVLTGVGLNAAALLAGEQPDTVPIVGLIPWLLRAQLLLPALQLLDVGATLWLLHRWRRDSARQPRRRGARARQIVLPLLPHLMAAIALKPWLSQRREYLRLYMPDISWIARVCGSVGLVWSVVRTGLVLRALGKNAASEAVAGRMPPVRSGRAAAARQRPIHKEGLRP